MKPHELSIWSTIAHFTLLAGTTYREATQGDAVRSGASGLPAVL